MYIDDKRYTWGYIIVLAVIIVLCLIGGLFGEAKAELITEAEAMTMDDWNDWENYTTEIKYLGGSDIHYMGYSQHNKITNEYRYITTSTHKADYEYISGKIHQCTGATNTHWHEDSKICKICNKVLPYHWNENCKFKNEPIYYSEVYHIYSGKCIICNYEKTKDRYEKHNYINGKCTLCNHECTHSNYDNGICIACGHTCNHTWILSNTIVTKDYKYQDYYKCNCGSEKFELRNIPESDWSDWTYYETRITDNKYYDTYQRTITYKTGYSNQYKDVDHVHVATSESASRSYAWHNAGNDCQYSVTRECDRCGCNYEDIKTIKKHEYKLDRVEDGHDVLVCVSCGDVVNREHVHKMQCVDHADSTTTKHGFNEYCCANCNYSYRVELPLISEYMYEKYFDEETGISYFESNVTSEYYYRALTKDGYIYAASFEELFVTIFNEEYDPLYFEEYFPYALTIETGVYTPPEV